MNQTPPLPQPSGVTCPNCGAAQAPRAKLCANCGAALTTVAKSALPPALRMLLKVLLTILLFFGAVGFGGLGACIGIVSVIGVSDPAYNTGSGNSGYFVAGAGIAAGLVCLWLINWINRKL